MTFSRRTTEYLILGALLVASSALILSRLGNIYLWQDEAQTALISKTILTHGIPLGYDGKNYFSQEFGAEYGRNYIYRWHPWFPFYLLAGFFAVFGTSTFVCRLPFALIGIATVILTYYFAASLWRDKRAGILSAVVLTVSVPFLILVRQCRYYSPEAFFSLLGLYGYCGLVEGRKRAGLVFTLSALLLFHTHFVQSAALLATIATHALIFERKALRRVLFLSGVVVLASLPWAIWLSGSSGKIAEYGNLLARTLVVAKYMIAQTCKHIFPPLILALAAITYALARLRHKPLKTSGLQRLSLLVLFAVYTIVSVSLTAPGAFFRYLAPLIPVACIIIGLIVESGRKLHPALGILAIGLLAWWWHMPSYLYEITHDYHGPVEAVVKYLNQNAKPDDIVAVNQESLPIAWYTGLKVVGGDSGEDFSAADKADWIVIRPFLFDVQVNFYHYLQGILASGKYAQTELLCPNLAFENREDVEEHSFRTEKTMSNVSIYHRVEK